jgi:hypothetical protein
VADRYFTTQEANEALAEVRPLAERVVEHRRRLLAANAKRAGLVAQIQGNGGGITPSDLSELEVEIDRHSGALQRSVERLQALGVLVKDLDAGLVDFPSLRDGEEVLLCWRLGEDAVEHWHGVDEGFAGRKRLEPGE